MSERESSPPPEGGRVAVYDWPTSVGYALLGTVVAVALIVLFTYLVDWIGDFWSQVVYFSAVLVAVVALAVRHRREDDAEPARLARASTPVTPAGLPGPFVLTQALGVLGVAMVVVGGVVTADRGLIWIFSGMVLVLVGLIGLIFWLAGMLVRRGQGPPAA